MFPKEKKNHHDHYNILYKEISVMEKSNGEFFF